MGWRDFADVEIIALVSTLGVWLGYFLTAIAAIPASALGLFLISKGVGPQAAILISVTLAVLGGFMAEQLVAFWSRKQRRLVVSRLALTPPSLPR
jgi:hypothetical protein